MKSYSDHTAAPITAAVSELDAKQTAEITSIKAVLAKYKVAFAALAGVQVLDLIGQLVRYLS